MRIGLFGLLLASLICVGCGPAFLQSYEIEEALTLQTAVAKTQAMDIPVRFFDEMLPARYQHKGIGIINDQETFQKMWDLYAVDTTALPPVIDFQECALLFVYDPNYYNLVSIVGLNVWKGIANPIVERTNWTLQIGGNPTMRKIKEKEGAKLPEPKVNVAFLQLLRNRENRPGVTAVLVEGNKQHPEKSLVIPVPEAP